MKTSRENEKHSDLGELTRCQAAFVAFGELRLFCMAGPSHRWLQIATAILIAPFVTRGAGLLLGAAIIAAAAITVLQHRAFSHLASLGLSVVLLALAEMASSRR